MKKRRLILCLLLVSTIIISMFPISATAAEPNPIIRVGLFYGNAALPAANLANEIGSGYNFGYFDASGYFTYLGNTYEEKITMVKNKNLYLSGGTYYEIIPSSGGTLIGAYHVDSGGEYGSFDEAAAAAMNLSNSYGLKSFPAYTGGSYRVHMGYYATNDAAVIAAAGTGLPGARAAGGSATCVLAVKTSTGEPLFSYDGEGATWLGVMPEGRGQDAVTWFRYYKYYGGFEYRRVNGNDITVINVADIQSYTKGVLPYEMNASWPLEALKAQALCAKNYVLYAAGRGKHRSLGFDVCNTTDCQVYQGLNLATANSNRAVDETYGYFIYYDGQLAQTYYHSSNGGSTEDAKNVWGTDYPYLRAVPDSFETLTAGNNGVWSATYTYDQIAQILRAKGHAVSQVVDVYIGEYTPAGNVSKLCIKDSAGKVWPFSGESARTILYSSSLNKSVLSQRYSIGGGGGSYYVNSSGGTISAIAGSFVIGKDGQSRIASDSALSVITGSGKTTLTKPSSGGNSSSVVIEGRGWGHNVGMSQYGAKGMAERGYGFDEIIKYYFTGVTVE